MKKPITIIKLIKVDGNVHTMEVNAHLNAVEIAREVMSTNKAIKRFIIDFKPVAPQPAPVWTDMFHSFIQQLHVN